jgi:hypothetical protein
MEIKFETLFLQAAELGRTKFGSTPLGQARKLVEEAGELEAEPTNLEEMADCLLALMIGCAASGRSAADLLAAAEAKLEVCWGRTWVEVSKGVYRHVEDVETPKEPE